MFNFNLFKKKTGFLVDLEKAQKEGWISKEEMLTLKVKRAENELKEFLEGKKKKK